METLLRAGLSNAVTATVLALLVACLSRLLARRPAILHGLWLLVLLKLITPPIYEVRIPWPIPETPASDAVAEFTAIRIESADALLAGSASKPDDLASAEQISEQDAASGEFRLSTIPHRANLAPPAPEVPIEWSRWAATAWVAGTLFVLVVSGLRIRRFQRLLRSASPATGEEREWVATLASVLNVRRVPEVCWVRARVSPLVWSLGWRPRLIIPHDFWKTLDERQRSTLVVHELAHLKRGDHLVRFLELLVTALYWWHPLIWWIRQSLRDAEEQCCDAWVVWAIPEAARSYAETLLDTLDFVHRSDQPEPLLASGLGKVPHLRRRLTMIMTGTTFRVLGVRGTLGLLAFAGIMLPVGATWAQQAQEPKEVKIVVKTDEELAEPGEDALHFTIDHPTNKPSQERKVVILRVDGQSKSTDPVVLDGSIDDVIKKLAAQITELKKGAKPTDADSERIETLVEALDQLKRASKAGPHFATYQVRLKTPDANDMAEIIKLRQEVFHLRKSMEKTLKELQATQQKIRKLGGDPGDVAIVEWQRKPKNDYRELNTVTIAKPVEIVKVDSTRVRGYDMSLNPKRPEVKTFTVSPGLERHVVIHRDEKKSKMAETPEPSRLESLEKRLKALQHEVDQLKKGSQ